MAISPTIANELSDEQLLTIAAVEAVVDIHLISQYRDGRPVVVRNSLIAELFLFDSKVLDAFIEKYEAAGWRVTKYENEKQGSWLNFTKQ